MAKLKSRPKLLVSIWTVDEVPEVIEGDADIVDVKDPSIGSLGLPQLDVVFSIVNIINKRSKEISIAIGDIKDYNHSFSYIAYTLSSLNVNYIKIGIEMNDYNKALYTVSQIKKTITYCNNRTNVVLVSYADWKNIGALEPLEIIEVAKTTRVWGVMIDTRIKNGKSTFDYIPLQYLNEFVTNAHKNGLYAAIAGGLKAKHIPTCVDLGFDVIGVRTAACSGGVRLGRISKEAIHALKTEIERHWSKLYSS